MESFDMTLMLMLLIPSAVCIAIGVIIQVATRKKKNKPAAGPVLTMSGILFAILSLIKILIKKTVAFIINVTVFFMILKHKL